MGVRFFWDMGVGVISHCDLGLVFIGLRFVWVRIFLGYNVFGSGVLG